MRFVPLITEDLRNRDRESINDKHGNSTPRRDRRPHVARRALLAAAFSDDAAGQADDPFTLRRYRVRLWHLYPDGLGIPVMPCHLAQTDGRVSGYTAALAINDALTMPRICRSPSQV
jgi:hypothetical protein